MKIQHQFNENSTLIKRKFNENPSVSNIIVVATSDHSSRELQMATDETHEI